MSNIALLTGREAAEAGSDSEFAGFTNPRAFQIGESTANRAINLMSAAFGNQWGANVRLAEAFSTSDFRLAAAAQLDSELLRQYEGLPTTWRSYTDVTRVRDFRPKRLKSRSRKTVGLARVPELTEYPAQDARAYAEYAIAVAKYGRRHALSWEAWLNNEAIDELEDLPGEGAREANETEMINAVANLLNITFDANGEATASDVNTAFFKTANGNAPQAVNLTRDSLKAVLDGMAVKGDPVTKKKIARPPLVLVVPKALESQVQSIMRPIEVRRTEGDVTTIESNEFGTLDYVVEPMLDYLNTNSKAGTTWFVTPKPGSPRPALWAAFLAGHETPDLRVRADAGQRVGGGDISPLEGSFEVDDIQFRTRHIVGNQQGDPLFTYASRGA